MSCMAAHAINDTITMNGTQMNAAFCTQISMAGPPVPDNATVRGEPPRGPNMPMVITSGVRNWTEDTPRLPSPALRHRADPLRSLGKKKLMLNIDAEKLQPQSPHRRASHHIFVYGGAGFCWVFPHPTRGLNSTGGRTCPW